MTNYTPNYPDILGYITQDKRQNIGVVQAALSVRPFAVKAGQPFEVILLLQNASDVGVEVLIKLNLPEKDKKNRARRFITKKTRIAVDMKPAEVGYVVLPASCLPDTALGAGYTVSMELSQTPNAKPNRIRMADGGGEIDFERIKPNIQQEIETLRNVQFSADGTRGLRSKIIEAQFNVMPGGLGQVTEFQPRWVSLWSLRDYADERLLLGKHREALQTQMLPQLNRLNVFKPLLMQTQQRFAAVGFPLQDVEALFVAKLFVLILEFAEPEINGHGILAAGDYSISTVLKHDMIPDDFKAPFWFRGMLKLMESDERVAAVPHQVIPELLYIDLLRDVLTHAFRMVDTATGEKLGTPEEIAQHIQDIVSIFKTAGQEGSPQLSFVQAYMPLVLGGIVGFDRILMAGERVDGMLVNMLHVLMARKKQYLTEETELIFKMGELLIERAMAKYGSSKRG